MTQTVQSTQHESTMHIPSSVLGIVLDTSTVSFKDAMKGIASAFLRMIGDNPHYLTAFLIAASDGATYPLVVNNETFERQWQEVPWGKTPAIVAGLEAMGKVMGEYTKPNAPTPAFRTLLLTASSPGDRAALQSALSTLGRVEIGVLGEEQLVTAYHDAIGYEGQVTITRIDDGDTWQEWVKTLYYSLN